MVALALRHPLKVVELEFQSRKNAIDFIGMKSDECLKNIQNTGLKFLDMNRLATRFNLQACNEFEFQMCDPIPDMFPLLNCDEVFSDSESACHSIFALQRQMEGLNKSIEDKQVYERLKFYEQIPPIILDPIFRFKDSLFFERSKVVLIGDNYLHYIPESHRTLLATLNSESSFLSNRCLDAKKIVRAHRRKFMQVVSSYRYSRFSQKAQAVKANEDCSSLMKDHRKP